LAKEQLTEMLASMPLTEKIALGFTASEFIVDCNYDGVPCNRETWVVRITIISICYNSARWARITFIIVTLLVYTVELRKNT